MSSLQVLAAVAAVISAFHAAATLVANVEERKSFSNDEIVTNERTRLRISLQTAEAQLGLRFSTEEARFGEIVRVGDGAPWPILRSPQVSG